MRETKPILLAKIEQSSVARPIIQKAVDSLAESIGNVGLIQPITVRKVPRFFNGAQVAGYQIVAGHHRAAACKQLGWEDIQAFVLPDGTSVLSAELIEIDENLCRAELSAAQRGAAIKRRKEIWEALNPEGVSAQVGSKPGGRPKEFASETESVTGESKTAINRHVARAEALGDDLAEVVGTSLDKGVELDALKDMEPEARHELIERAKAGEKVTARAANDDTDRLRKLVVQAINEVAKLANYGSPAQVSGIAFTIPMSKEADEFLNVLSIAARLYVQGQKAA